jgi:DNA uptake protein ComE-like DNA-binding protein
MKRLPSRRLAAACGILAFSIVLLAAPPASGERSSDAAALLLRLLGFDTGRERWAPRKLDVNSATVEELAGLPSLERRQAQRITSNRPYAQLQDLARAGLSARTIEQLTAFVTVSPSTRSGSPAPTKTAPAQQR